MTAAENQKNRLGNQSIKQHSLVNSVRILSEVTRRDIEKSYNIEKTQGTEAYYSNRYGWTLRRIVD